VTGALAALAAPMAALDPLSATFNPLSATSWLDAAGPVAVLLVLFAETGLLIGFFLPGDSLLVTAGLLCAVPGATGTHLSLATVLPAAAIGAVVGAQTGWLIGRRVGPPLLERRGSRLGAGIERASALLERYGYGKALVLARFIPVVRTVANPLAGIAGLSGSRFLVLNLLGGLPWSLGIVLAGYLLGSRVAGIDRYLLPVIAVVVVVSLLPLVVEVLRERRRS